MIVNMVIKTFSVCALWLYSSLIFAAGSINLVIVPDSIGSSSACHHIGAEFGVTPSSSLGVLARFDCHTNRSATGGDTNDAVNNTFNRILIPWRYAINGVFTNGYFIQPTVGIEKDEYRSELGSQADVTFAVITLHIGYQWFWTNGFNLSVLGGAGYLLEVSSRKTIVPSERSDVIAFLDENTRSDIHPTLGVMLGWMF